MAQLFVNNATSRLAADIAGDLSSLTITTGDGSLFPATDSTDSDHFLVTLENSAGDREIIKVTWRAGDTFEVIERAQEGTVATAFSAGDLVELRLTAGFIDAIKRGSVVFVIDGGGAAITTGIKGFIEVPFSGSIEAVRLFGDSAAGDMVVDIWKDTFANYPPVVGDSICGSSKPTLAGWGWKGQLDSAALIAAGWTLEFEAGDILYFNVDSNGDASTTKCTVSLTVDRN